MPTRTKVTVMIDTDLRRSAIRALSQGESLTDFIQVAMRAEVGRRCKNPPTAPEEPKLPRGRRPKP